MHVSEEIPVWYPLQAPIYNIHLSYAENAENGPFFDASIPTRQFAPESEWYDFLGYKVASRLGIPAGPLLTSHWVNLAGKLGFDILTYKTIRSGAHPSHPIPNMVYVDPQGIAKETPSERIEELAVTNSFGMPSKSPEFLLVDIPKAKESLVKGQVLVVSIVGTARPGLAFALDFVAAAKLAKSAGADILEANFSCPNVGKAEGCLYLHPDTVYEIASKIVAATSLPLILKMGIFASTEHMREVLLAAARAGVRAISGINTVQMKIVNKTGAPALGNDRPLSGVCGGPIRHEGLQFVRMARAIIDQEKLDLTLIGVGGITLPHHFEEFFQAGADFAMSATGMMWDPYLALRYHGAK